MGAMEDTLFIGGSVLCSIVVLVVLGLALRGKGDRRSLMHGPVTSRRFRRPGTFKGY